MKDPFSLGTPSVFVVSSPFQAFCAVSAIHNLQIKEYKVIVILTNLPRDIHLVNLLNNVGVDYSVFTISKLNLCIQIVKIFIGCRRRMYDRLFLGYFNNIAYCYIGFPYINKESSVVYLDDGTATLSFLCGVKYSWGIGKHVKLINFFIKRKRVEVKRNFYTIYSDIVNDKINIVNNDISKYLKPCHSTKSAKNIIIIGTNSNQYCHHLFIDKSVFIRTLRDLFLFINEKYPNEDIIYVPHGSDNSEYAKMICNEFHADFHPLDKMIELYYQNMEQRPVAIYGFCSTALLNIKRMCKNQEIYNVFIYKTHDCLLFTKYKTICEYYDKNGIPCINWDLNNNDSRLAR